MFARQLSFFIVTVYIPCSMTVSVSWLSFWLDHKAVSITSPLSATDWTLLTLHRNIQIQMTIQAKAKS